MKTAIYTQTGQASETLQIVDLSEMLKSGEITAPIHTCLPLEKIAEAHDLVDATTTIGNVVLKLE